MKKKKKPGKKISSKRTTRSTRKKSTFDLHRYIVSVLRRASYRMHERTKALNKAKVVYGKYRCANCSEVHARKDIQVDHIHPIVPLTGFDNWDGYISRLFCDEADLQILCKPCHKIKTQIENAERRENAKKTRRS